MLRKGGPGAWTPEFIYKNCAICGGGGILSVPKYAINLKIKDLKDIIIIWRRV